MKTFINIALLFLLCVECALGQDSANGKGTGLLKDCTEAVSFMDGNVFKATDTWQDIADRAPKISSCIAVVHGVADMADVWGSVMGISMPSDGDAEQNVRVVLKYLQDHPEELSRRDTLLIIRALRKAFPKR